MLRPSIAKSLRLDLSMFSILYLSLEIKLVGRIQRGEVDEERDERDFDGHAINVET